MAVGARAGTPIRNTTDVVFSTIPFNALVPRALTMSLLPDTYFDEERERAKLYQRELVDEGGQSLYRKPFYLRFLPLGSSDQAYQKVILKNIVDLERASGLLTDDKQRQRIALYVSSGQKVLDTDSLLCLGGAAFVTLRTRNRQSLSLPFKGPMKHANPDVFPSENFYQRYPVIGRLIRAQDKRSAQFQWLALRFSLNLALAYLGIGFWNLIAPPIPSTRRILGDSHFREHFASWRAAQQARLSEPRSVHDLKVPSFPTHRFPDAASQADSLVQSPVASSAVGVFSRQNVDQNPQWSRVSPEASESLATSPSVTDSTDSGIFEDDASPIAPQHRGMDDSERKNQPTTWEQIRRRAQQEQQDRGNIANSGQHSPQEQHHQQPERREDEKSSTSYRYSETDREKAQREFDALLEEERKGGSQAKRW